MVLSSRSGECDPTMLASGSDDGFVKLRILSRGECVQFRLDSARSIVFGSMRGR